MAIFGLFFLALALAVGARIGAHYNFLRVPIEFWTLAKPALNLAALGLPIYGYTLLISAVDYVRWRATMIGSVLTLAGFIAWVVSVIPVLQKYTWRVYLERVSIFKLYNPVDDVSTGESLLFNLAVLAGIARGASFSPSSPSSAATCRPTDETSLLPGTRHDSSATDRCPRIKTPGDGHLNAACRLRSSC